MLRRLLQGVLIGLAAAALALLAWRAGWLDRIEARTRDMRVQHFAKRETPSDRIGLIFLDQASLDWGAGGDRAWPWPWPREVYAPILQQAATNGARAVAFDAVFTEPSRLGVEDDAALGAAIRANGHFVVPVFLATNAGSATTTNWPAKVPAPRAALEGDLALAAAAGSGFVFPRCSFPIPEVATNAAWLGNVASNPDPDGTYRRTRLFALFDGRLVPSLSLATYLAAHPDTKVRLDGRTLRAGAVSVPLDATGRALLRYRGPSQAHATISAAYAIDKALKGGSPDLTSFFRDRYILLGYTAPGLYDLKTSPTSAAYPGVEIHATALDNLLAGDFMRDAAPAAVAALIVGLALLAGTLSRICRNAAQTVAAFAVVLPLPAILGYAAYSAGVWLPIVAPLAAVAPALIGGLVVNYAVEGRQKRFIKNAFRQYLSPVVIDQLVQQPGRLALGGERRELTIFFSDIQGFSGISERMNPEALTGFLNEYLTAMTDIIMEEGGTVDKYEGDAIIAFWNAPVPQDDHPARAVRAALRGQAKLAELRPAFREKTGRDVWVRIGINTGDVVVGNMGSNQRFDYTFLGDAGNLASRLEGVNKQFGSYLMISKATRDRLGPEFQAREISRVMVVGRAEPVVVFEPMLPAEFARRQADFDAFAQGLTGFYAGKFQEAAAIFRPLADRDPVAANYAGRCERMIAQPPADWKGVIALTEK